MIGDKLLAERSCVDMKPEQNKSHRKQGEKEYLIQYQPSKEQAGEMVWGQPGKGSTVNIYPPQAGIRDPHRLSAGRGDEVACHKQLGTESERQEDGLRKAGGDAPPEIQSGGEIILMAEDEPAVRSVLLEVLRMEGYVVMEATDGEEAIRVFLANQDAIDLVILDESMPRKNGLEVYEEIKKARVGIKVLLMSGYTEDVVFSEGVRDKAVEFISKPLLPEELLKKVRETLDKA
jgi:CheY-like chemotaxis protein